MCNKLILATIVILMLLSATAVALAGSQLPPGGPAEAAGQMYSLAQIYDRLATGAVNAPMSVFTEPNNGPNLPTMHSLNEIMALAPSPDDVHGATTADVPAGKTFWGLTSGQWGVKSGAAPAGADVAGVNGLLVFPIPDGFYTGARQCSARDANLAAENIKAGVSVFGVIGSYRCQTGQTDCGGACTNTATDRNNCGSCGHECPAGHICSTGVCVLSCQAANCGGVCTNVATDLHNCGSCGHVCLAGQICTAGVCVLSCQTGLTNCNGACTNLQSDNNSCGVCGYMCPAGKACRDGACT